MLATSGCGEARRHGILDGMGGHGHAGAREGGGAGEYSSRCPSFGLRLRFGRKKAANWAFPNFPRCQPAFKNERHARVRRSSVRHRRRGKRFRCRGKIGLG